MRITKKLFVPLLFLFCCSVAYAQQVNFEVSAPPMVAVGNAFRVEFTINSKPDNDNFSVPNISTDGLDVIAGPTMSSGSTVSVINGNVKREEVYSYTYVLVASKPGMYTIPAAKITAGGREYTTKATPVEVVEEQQQPQQQPGAGGNRQPSNSISSDDLLIRAVIDKSNVYKGQPVRLYFKLYSRVRIAGTESVKMPAFNGFWSQELSTDHYKWQTENYNSKVYETVIFREFLLYPQQAGTLQIDPLEMTIAAQIVTQRKAQSIFDDFFGGGPQIEQVSKRISTSPIKIKVNDWPAGAPAGFNGAVGNFTMSSEFPEGSVNANSSANYVLRISGNGNLPLIQAPRFEVPGTFEQYNVKTTESLNKTVSGISGYRQFEFPLIARAEGNYTIDPVEFSYFNPETARYVTLESKEYNVMVLPDSSAGGRTLSGGGGGIVTGLSKEDIKVLGEDIRFIKLGASGLVLNKNLFAGSLAYFLILLGIVAVFVFALIYLKKRIKEMHNMERMRGKRANKVALQRLKAADNYMKEGNSRNFYEEMLRALWGYMSDKLNIPAAILTKENVREELLKRNIPSEHVSRYTDLISDCEYAQYSPSGSGHMQEIYANAVKSISKLESLIKKKR